MFVIYLLISEISINNVINFPSINKTLKQQKHKIFSSSVSYFLEAFHTEIQVSSLYITSLISLETKSEFRRLYFILNQKYPPPPPPPQIFSLHSNKKKKKKKKKNKILKNKKKKN